MPIDPSELRQAMGHFATGVTILTTRDGAGRHTGLTANAICSVSLEPPLVLACVAKSAESYPAFAASRVFTINVLADSQEALSRRFAKSGGEKFEGVGFRLGRNGAAVLDGVLAHVECELRHELDAGDHTIYVGEAVAVSTSSEGEPLLFYRGGYRNLAS